MYQDNVCEGKQRENGGGGVKHIVLPCSCIETIGGLQLATSLYNVPVRVIYIQLSNE